MKYLLTCVLVVGTLSCASLTKKMLTPEGAASDIIIALDEGDTGTADGLFSAVREDDTDRVYPILYNAAEDRYATNDVDRSVEILRFMAPRYPEALSVREALLYGLFLQRSEALEADPVLHTEMEGILKELEEKQPSPPLWLDLVATQVAIDSGRLDDARESFDRFLSSWNGMPSRLALYVEDLGRYLASH